MPLPLNDTPQGITLHQYLSHIRRVINGEPNLQQQWVIAEISDFRFNRHCYMQLIEKDAKGNTIAAIKATLWQSSYYFIQDKFSRATGQQLGNGMKVMLRISANMSEQYGLSANISDISPEFTLGDMQRIRREILQRLQQEGIIDMNKELPVPQKPQRIAVISAAGAAGYGDFCNQLAGNKHGIVFYTALFAASMQGKDTAPTVIRALERINEQSDMFDVIVIIRGGGSTNDLNSFDNYELAANVANSNLPVITGIGHERDVTVLDYVAAIPVKTPTAAAEWIIGQCTNCLIKINDLTTEIANIVASQIREERQHLEYFSTMIPDAANAIIDRQNLMLRRYMAEIPALVGGRIDTQRAHLGHYAQRIADTAANAIQREKMRLQNLSDKAELLSPQNILNRGYSITTIGGHAIADASEAMPGDIIVTRLKSGSITSTITQTNK